MKEIVRIPGLVDPHVHLREPGPIHKEDFDTGSQAAVAGGYTIILDMPNNPGAPTITPEALQEKADCAEDRIHCDVGFHFGATVHNAEYFERIENRVFGLKIYMNDTTGDLLVNEEEGLNKIFANWHSKKPILVHAEATTLRTAINLARRYHRRLHACHISLAEEIDMIREAKDDGVDVTCEVTPHHLFLTGDDITRLGAFGRMKPPLATRADVNHLWKNIDHIDILATDHAPHTRRDKERVPLDEAPYGVPGLETALPLMLTAVHEGRLTLEKLVHMASIRPREIFGISEDDSYVEVDMKASYKLPETNYKTKSNWSPFAGESVVGMIKRVSMRGKVIFENDTVIYPPRGKVMFPK